MQGSWVIRWTMLVWVVCVCGDMSHARPLFIFKGFVPDCIEEAECDAVMVPCRLLPSAGLLRAWDFRPTEHGRQTIAAVRVPRGTERPSTVNGVLMSVPHSLEELKNSSRMGDDASMNLFVQRPLSDLEPTSWQSLPAGVDHVWVLAVQPAFIKPPTAEFPLLQSNVDKLLLAFLVFGEDYAREYLDTTHNFPTYWVNDRQLARRPWVHQPKFKLLDELCHSHPVAPYNTFQHRCLSVEYAAALVTPPERPAAASSSSASAASTKWAGRKLSQAAISDFLFGFGSLINTKSRMSSDGDARIALPVRVSASVGYARAWNFQHPLAQITALGLRKTDAASARSINGIVMPVLSAAGMAALDEREVGYTRVPVNTSQFAALTWARLPDRARVWLYVPNGRGGGGTPGVGLQGPSFRNPILQSYVDVCLLGCLEQSRDYAIEFINSTTGWDGPWMNDRILPRRPWVHQPRYREIDELLAAHVPDAFLKRMLPEEFGAAMAIAKAHEVEEHDEFTSEGAWSVSDMDALSMARAAYNY